MLSTPHIRELLAEGNIGEIGRVIESGTERGLISFNMCLRRLVQERKADVNDALAASDRPEELILALRGFTGRNSRPDVDPANSPNAARGGGADGLRMGKRDSK